MSSGTGPTTPAPAMSWDERAAREASAAHREAAGAHQDTGQILALLDAGQEEADPIAAISEAQLLTIDRQKIVLERLDTILKEVGKVIAVQEGHGLEMQALRTELQTLRARCDATYARLVEATTRPAQPGGAPASA